MGLGAGLNHILDRDKDKEKDKDKERDKEKDRERDKPRREKHRDKDKDEEEHDAPAGWTSMVEDWLCHGNASCLRQSGSPTIADIGFPKPLTPRVPSKESRKGPYQLLTKERMMGIYLAVYVHRDIRPLVRGKAAPLVPLNPSLTFFRHIAVCGHCRLDWWEGWEQGRSWDHCEH